MEIDDMQPVGSGQVLATMMTGSPLCHWGFVDLGLLRDIWMLCIFRPM